ncbi:hypothetical protein FOA52_007971 [Chlamydomonas sp. UWO 241]|nr:hypothetical protein FOA52_007971 [Chlamydomonas sp. UWO 241]
MAHPRSIGVIAASVEALLGPQLRGSGGGISALASASCSGVPGASLGASARGYAGDVSANAPSSTKRIRSRTGSRYGSRLLRAGMDAQYARMRGLLGVGPPSDPPKRVTVSILQSLNYLELPPDFKMQLAAYRAAALGAELAPLLAKTRAMLAPQEGKERGQKQ